MSQLRPSSLKPPGKVAKPSGLVQPKVPSTITTENIQSKQTVADGKIPSGSPEDSSSNPSKSALAPKSSEVQSRSAESVDFKFGDKVWVAGSKPGVIAFIGETQFAPGEWAGVILDAPVGKNDGSVAGVRYFSCDPLYGIFSKLSNLSHSPISGGRAEQPVKSSAPVYAKQRDSLASNDSGVITSKTSSADELPTPEGKASGLSNQASNNVDSGDANADALDRGTKLPAVGSTSSRSTGLVQPTSRDGSQVSGPAAPRRVAADSGASPGTLQIGCRVIVSGNKVGTLRYVGTTHFAKGEWAGVELVEPLGKNDGSVEGKRYFSCTPLYGLFAPLGKVTATSATAPAANAVATTTASSLRRPSVQSVKSRTAHEQLHTMAQERSGSQESLSSMSSVHSSASRSRIAQLKTNTQAISPAAGSSALQKALKEKEEHIQQLLVERDLERSEMARMAARVDEVESLLSATRVRYDMHVSNSEDQLQLVMQTVEKLEVENTDLRSRLDEEKKKVDDLQFAVEEATIDEGDIRLRAETDKRRLKELENQLEIETQRSYQLQQQLNNNVASSVTSNLEDKSEKLKLDMEQLSQRLTEAEKQLSSVAFQRDEFRIQVEKLTKEILEKNNELSEFSTSAISQSSTISQLNVQLEALQIQLLESNGRLLEYQSNIDGLQEQLESSVSKATKIEELKTKMEQQLSELVSRSGNSSEQLELLSKELVNRDSTISDQQNAIKSMQSRIDELNAELAVERQAVANKTAELSSLRQSQTEELQTKYTAMMEKLTEEKQQLESDKEKLSAEVSKLEVRFSALDKELTELKGALSDAIEESSSKSAEIQSLLQQIEALNSSHVEVKNQVTSLQLSLETLEADKAQVSSERTHWESLNKLLESKVSELQERLSSALVKQNQTSSSDAANATSEALESLKNENTALRAAKTEFESRLSALETQLEAERHLRAELEAEKRKLDDQLSSVTVAHDNLKQSQSVTDENLNEFRRTNQQLQVEKDSLSKMLETQNEKYNQLLVEVTELKTQSNENSLKHQSVVTSLQTDKETLLHDVSTYRQQLDEKEFQLKILHKEVDSLRSELSVWQQKATDAEETDDNIAEGSSAEKNVGKRESAQDEIKFLNAVIVDLQNKNDALQQRLDAFMSIDDEVDMPNTSSDSLRVSKTIAPRLFCDICDMFDQHDTEDCPVQASADSPPRSTHNADKATSDSNGSRPYCEICEVFGHWSDDCDDQQTF